MNWTIKGSKRLGREYLQRSFWNTWFVTAVMSFISMGTTFSAIISLIQQVPYIAKDLSDNLTSRMHSLNIQAWAVIITLSCGMLLLNVIIKIVIAIFIRNPASVGSVYFMRKIAKDEPDGKVADLAFAFDNNYLNHLKTMLLRGITTAVFTLLLVVPGIIKSYEYRMVPYILSEQPDIAPREALALSSKIMKNQKMKLFLLDLSFVPWHILGTLTLGILEMFYVIPWGYTTEVAIYNELRKGI